MLGLPLLIEKTDFLSKFLSDELIKYVLPLPNLLLGFAAALLLTPIIGKIANKYRITYKPGASSTGKAHDNPEKAIHDVETPRLGGLAIMIPLLIFVFFSFGWNPTSAPFIVALLIMIVGAALDDIYDFPAIVQLLTHFIAALVIVSSVVDLSIINIPLLGEVNFNWGNLSFNFLGIPWSLIFPGDFIILGWIMICINAVKWMGGSPGLVESNSFVAFIMLYILGIRTFSEFVSVNSIFLAGALLGLLVYAFPPQKIFSGTSGKALYGFIIAVFAIINGAKFASTLMIILLPMIDFVYVLVKRMIKYKVYNPLKLMRINGTDHLHHQLIGLGLSRKQVLLAEGSVTLLFGLIAVLSIGALKLFLLIGSALAIMVGILVANVLKQRNDRANAGKSKQSPEGRYAY